MAKEYMCHIIYYSVGFGKTVAYQSDGSVLVSATFDFMFFVSLINRYSTQICQICTSFCFLNIRSKLGIKTTVELLDFRLTVAIFCIDL